MLLSVIIPYRSTDTLPYIAERIAEKSHFKSTNEIEFIFVDAGSSYRAEELKQKIRQNNNKYIRIENENEIFSPGMTRNMGIREAQGDVLTFMDADYDCEDAMFEQIMEMIRAKKIDTNKNEFFIIPCLFLTENGTRKLAKYSKEERRSLAMNDLVYGKNKLVHFLGIVSSSIVVNRAKFLALGGNRREMFGHGFEDFESLYRVISSSGKVKDIPEKMSEFNPSWQGTKYEGHRAYLSLMAREALAQGIFMIHNWHGKMPADYKGTSSINFDKFTRFISDFEKNENMPLPMCGIEGKHRVLFVHSGSKYSMVWHRDLMPYIGEPYFITEDAISSNGNFDAEKFQEVFDYNNTDIVLMFNPYKNVVTRELYRYLRHNRINFLCMERGALPDSWFLDNGFNTDSDSYKENKWNFFLSKAEIAKTEKYIRETLKGANFLEKQGPRIGGNALKNILGLTSEKILFVPLQNSEDTTIKYFAGNAGNVAKFIFALSELADHIKHLGWKIVCKKHPLDNNYDLPDNLICAPNDSNILDLLEMADSVALINSGVGIYAMMMEKPCFIFGKSFYQQEGLNYQAESIYDVLHHIKGGLPRVDREKMIRFIHHLISNVYSFGHASTHTKNAQNGTTMTCTDKIDFYRINIGNLHLEFDKQRPEPMKQTGMAFDQFRHYLSKKQKLQEEAQNQADAPDSNASRA